MRVSSIGTDAGYNHNHSLYRIFLNGREVKHCFIADEEKGYVECYKLNERGSLYAEENGELASFRRKGKVTITRLGGENE